MPAPTSKSPHASGALTGSIILVLTLIGWSSIPLFIEHFSGAIDLWTSNGWRYGFAALLWLPVVLWGLVRRSLPPGLFAAALVPSLFNAAGQVCFTWAHYKIDPGLLTFGMRTQIVFVALGAYMLFPAERPVIRARTYLLGVAMVVAGTVGTVMLGREPPTGASAVGIGLAVGAGLLFAGYALSVRRRMHGVNSVVAFAAISQYTAVAMVTLMLVLGDDAGAPALALGPRQFALLLLSSIIGIALGHVFYYISIARLGVAVSAGVLQLQPFLVAVGSWSLFGEQLTGAQWGSGAVAISGALLMLTVQGRLSRAAAKRAAAVPSAGAAAPAVPAVAPRAASSPD